MHYLIKRATTPPQLKGEWDSPPWSQANVVKINSFHPNSSDHRPVVQAKVLYDESGIYVIFRVEDRYVICTRTEHQTLTSKDSCVEVYFQPFPDRGYLNFEMNCGGALLLFHVIDPTRVEQGVFKEKTVVPQSLLDTMQIYHSLPKSVTEEIDHPVTWTLEYFIPNALFETYVGPLVVPAERCWRGNFFKCGDESSHPHWASWAPIGEFNFHVPRYFAPITFEG